MDRCRRCRRPLKSEKAIRLGYGYSCYKKAKAEGIEFKIIPDFIGNDNGKN